MPLLTAAGNFKASDLERAVYQVYRIYRNNYYKYYLRNIAPTPRSKARRLMIKVKIIVLFNESKYSLSPKLV